MSGPAWRKSGSQEWPLLLGIMEVPLTGCSWLASRILPVPEARKVMFSCPVSKAKESTLERGPRKWNSNGDLPKWDLNLLRLMSRAFSTEPCCFHLLSFLFVSVSAVFKLSFTSGYDHPKPTESDPSLRARATHT